MSPSPRRFSSSFVLIGCVLAGSVAHGAAFHIEARTEAQAYQIRAFNESTPGRPVLLPRRRIVQYLSLNIFEIVTGEDFGFESNLRVFDDFGMSRSEASLLDGTRAVGGDLLYAHVRYRKGGFEGALGRQLYVDVMDFMAFDGARLRYTLPFGLGAEAYAGLWVKGSSFMGSSVYQPDGTRESDARRIALGVPGTTDVLDDFAPVFGGKVFLADFYGFGASLGYRRSMVAGKTDLERAAAELKFGRGRGFNAMAGAEMDLFSMRMSQLRGTVRYDGDLFALMAEVMRLSPILSADSIWYYFAFAPRDEGRVRADWTPPGPFRFYGQLSLSRYNDAIDVVRTLAPYLNDPRVSRPWVLGPTLGGAARWRSWRTALDLTYRNGVGGQQTWVDLTGGYSPQFRPYSVDTRLSYAWVNDPLNPFLRGSFWGAQLWASYALSPVARLSAILEENINPFTRSETKLFLLFDLKATL